MATLFGLASKISQQPIKNVFAFLKTRQMIMRIVHGFRMGG